MHTLHFSTTTRQHEQGFTLVEIMVAMVIGMLGIIIMMQMSSMFESQKRTTTGGDDALNAGAIALNGLQQDTQQAGYCFASASSAAIPAPTLNWTGATLSPVKVNYAPISGTLVDPATDTIMVAYGNDSCAPESASGVASTANINVLAYKVLNQQLWRCDYVLNDCALAASWAPIAGDVVSLKAQCASSSTVRIALVLRNHQLIKPVIDASGTHHATGVPPQDFSALPTWSGTSSAINLAALPNSAFDQGFGYQDYRYKTFQTLVPIRNSDWTGAPGCL